MEERTDIIETTPRREVVETTPRVTEVTTTAIPRASVDRIDV